MRIRILNVPHCTNTQTQKHTQTHTYACNVKVQTCADVQLRASPARGPLRRKLVYKLPNKRPLANFWSFKKKLAGAGAYTTKQPLPPRAGPWACAAGGGTAV